MPIITNEEKEWRAECDANTLAEARIIQKDQDRLNRAKKAAEKIAEKKG